ncbi:MAG: hypothetical protein CMK43_02785 [Porticoccaceae bacterium]|nr:hypothetical protein [Porticoccaceae bacterium]|tara:strand:- start:29 stop:421 length:393 start_codon:yes stop_codon:yes gene_type:complete
MSTLPYEYYIDIVTKRYFHAVDNYDLEGVLDCFHSDATLTEVTTMTRHDGRDQGIKTMFQGLFKSFSHIWHGNFVHTADSETQSICSQFTVLITPDGGEELRYENCNRFYLRDGKFSEVFVYMSGDNLLR